VAAVGSIIQPDYVADDAWSGGLAEMQSCALVRQYPLIEVILQVIEHQQRRMPGQLHTTWTEVFSYAPPPSHQEL